jgi:RHS repeat-associated protein
MSNPIIAGTFSSNFGYTNTQNTTSFTNDFTGRPTNDVFYKFTTSKKMEVTIKHCGSALSDTYVHLLDASGNVIAYNDDYSGTGACSTTTQSYLKKELDAGTYYVVSESWSQNGSITTNISGTVINVKGDSFNDPIIAGTFSNDFQYSDTQNTVNYTNQHTVRGPNDIFYRFTLTKKALVTITHCGSLFDTYMFLLDASGNTLASNDDYSGEGSCTSSFRHAFIQQTLNAGTYYVVSEGYSGAGLVTTNITGYSSGEFDYPDIPNAYSSDSEAVGAVGSTFNVSATGGAAISIPIDVPPGVGGMQPSLAIAYNSQSGNGVAGWGCNISGLSVITRAPKDIYHDGTAKALTYQADEAYYLDGQRLIHSSGTPGQEGAVYYMEADPLTKVTIHGTYNTTTANTWFEVQASNGMKYYYGNTASGRLSYYIGNAPRIYAWYIDYAEDPMGNYMTYTYNNYSQTMYPNTITYGNNKNESTGLINTITFDYQSRNDISTFYIDGVKGKMYDRLINIESRTGNNIYRSYELKYDDTSDGTFIKFSRLTTVAVKNTEGEVLKPVKLNWTFLPSFYGYVNQPTVNAASSYPSVSFGEQQFASGDYNGDGLTDFVGVAPVRIPIGPNSWQNDTYAYVYYASLDSYGTVKFTSGTNYSLGAGFKMGDWSEMKGSPMAVDFDGNGINDLIIPNASIIQDINCKFVEYVFKGGAFNGLSVKAQLKCSGEIPINASGDFNNDGRGDIIYIEKGQCGGKYPGEVIGLNSGTTLFRGAFNLSLPSTPEKMFVSDFNGDGLDDMIVLYSGGYSIYWNQGYGISTSTFTDSKKTTGNNFGAGYWTMIRSGDFNGDGLMDFIINDTNDTNWYFALNNGNGTFSRSVACSIYAHDQSITSKDDDKFECLVYDFDADGKDDVVITKAMYISFFPILNKKTYTYWMRSTGSALTQVALATSDREDDARSSRFFTGDFNGDGLVDLMNYGYNCYGSTNANSDPVWRLCRNGNFYVGSGKINTITDSYGSTTNIAYASLANGGIYTRGTGSTYPVADFTTPIHAVKSVSINNGAAGYMYTNYLYSGLKIHLQGKGILGMASRTENNTTLGIITESGVKSWNTTFHIPSATYAKTTMDGKTAETNVALAVVDKGSKKYFTYPSTKTEKDLDGNIVTTTYKYNTTYGYPEEEKTDFGNNMYKTVQYSNYILAGGSYMPQLITSLQKHTDDAAVFTQKTAITYDAAKGYRKQVIENKDAALQLTTDYTYDNIGNMLTSKQSGTGITPVTVNSNYDATKRFLIKTFTLPASSVSTFTYDSWGRVLMEKDETLASNILSTVHTYDNWGNRTSTVLPDGTKNTIKRGWNNDYAKCYFTLTQGTAQPWVKTWYDNKGREVLVETIGPKSAGIKHKTTYNGKGEVMTKEVQTASLTTTENFTYDVRGRLASSSNSTGMNVVYTYDNRKVTTTNNGRVYIKTIDPWGGVKTVTDPVSSIAYTYKSLGKPQSITTGGATVSITYDAIGNQTALSDPNAGTSTFTYDAAGRLIKQIDGKGKTTVNVYDALGRLSTTTIDGIATAYTYGTSGNDLLLLTKLQTGNNYTAYTYDKYGRIATEKRQVEGTGLLEFSYAYNTQGQLSTATYPGSLQVSNQYDAYGNVLKVLTGTQSVWELTGETGLVSTVQLGGTLTATRTRNAQGLLTNLKTVKGSTVLHNMDFVFDGTTGNLMSRTGMVPQTESFSYDNVDRLTSVKHGTSAVMSMDYKPNGNINSKTGLGQYSYGTKPHAVTGVDNTSKLVSTENQIINYTAFNKVSGISEKVGADNFELNFTYGPNQQRWKTILKKNGNVARTTVFAGNYETITENGQTKQLYYISGGDGLAAIYVKQSGQSDKIYYPHFDHLGSIVKLTDGNGSEAFKASYDAWGNRTVSNNAFAFHRGYTGHEHLKEFALIDMNGRVYDLVLGRFLSPDPFVQLPEFSQNYNRYSYCLNNPLKYTDPSGEWFGIDDLIIGAAGFVFGYVSYGISTGNWGWKAFGAGGMGAVSAWLGYNIGGVATGKITGSTWGFMGSMAANTAINQVMPVPAIPIGNNFALSVSPGLGLGTNGLTGGMNIGASYTDGDFSIGAGIGVGNNHWGWNAAATFDGWGVGYGRTYYGASEVMGQKFGAQAVGTFTGYFNHNSLSISNDLWGGVNNEDRWRTSAVELTIGRFSVGTYLYTNDGRRESQTFDGSSPLDDADNCVPSWPVGRNKNKGLSTWRNGRVYFAPAWIGYRSKNGNQITRIGFSHKVIHNLTQNWVHKGFGKQNYYMSYDEFKTGGFFYSGYHNPFSLWER